ncbi:replication factor C subunit 3-like [Nicotiana sylvestris]|uniref:replication factor C subunit 3-like n=1 Tax=Nicotiana sylvestris TaxID=4096 RepID=UPI00388C484D
MYTAIILGEADKLSTDALLYTKWMLERYTGCYMVFFCCSDITKLQPIKSICKVVHLQKPSDDEIADVLEFIAKQEGIELPHKLAAQIASNSKSNLRQAIRSFEATWHFNTCLTENQEIKTGWEDDIAKIAKNIIEEQSSEQLYDIRGKLQNLIEHNVSAEFIFKVRGS